MTKTFGPSVYFDRDGEPHAACMTASMYCFMLHGKMCTADSPRTESREVPDFENTPDWCKYRAGVIEGAKEMRDFDRLGLSRMTRRELMAEARGLPEEFRPKPLSRAKAHNLRKAIRRAALVAEAGA